VFGAVLVFTGFLLWKYRPRWPFSHPSRRVPPVSKRQWADIEEQVREAREQARAAATPRDRAVALVRAAEAAAQTEHVVTSMGLYIRAMRADEAFCDPIRGITALLRKDRPELLETVLWRRLAHLSWSGNTAPAAKCAAEALAMLYRHELRHRDRARVLRKVAGMLG